MELFELFIEYKYNILRYALKLPAIAGCRYSDPSQIVLNNCEDNASSHYNK
jgi:hypothetical protein